MLMSKEVVSRLDMIMMRMMSTINGLMMMIMRMRMMTTRTMLRLVM